jgi:hypothetical protein
MLGRAPNNFLEPGEKPHRAALVSVNCIVCTSAVIVFNAATGAMPRRRTSPQELPAHLLLSPASLLLRICNNSQIRQSDEWSIFEDSK